MIFPAKLTLQDYAYALDGGTTALIFTDERGEEQTVVLNQHAYIPEPEYFDRGLPGRLYFNEELIEVRSSQEQSLLSLLKSAEVRHFAEDDPSNKPIEPSPNRLVFGDDLNEIFNQTPEENLHSMLKKVIAFVESDEYVTFAEEVNQKLKEQET
jgi:hypothetical protein